MQNPTIKTVPSKAPNPIPSLNKKNKKKTSFKDFQHLLALQLQQNHEIQQKQTTHRHFDQHNSPIKARTNIMAATKREQKRIPP